MTNNATDEQGKLDIVDGHISLLWRGHEQFLTNLKANNPRHDHVAFPPRFEVATGDKLSVTYSSVTMNLSNRIVRYTDDQFFMEYAFTTRYKDEDVELFKFYLNELGHLTDAPGNPKFGTSTATVVGHALRVYLVKNLIASKVFAV
ncbi:hypothetical protein GTP44_01035 [Duganella sp. FT50W]|uniref:Uncharacterized protein n=1 Tax=Duganella lactea TaxID=2692173 RepID=A0A6L8MDR3_9BURK|nr:hypothetical protein [Duganella lactea]MYM80544.1 hypothetical protein [Duganella lactea]